MRLIIYLASHDPSAKANYDRLVFARSGLVRDIKFCLLNCPNEKLTFVREGKKDIFSDIALSEKNDVAVEFIAHGNPNFNNEILSLEKGKYAKDKSYTFDHITPKILAEFFKIYASEDSKFKFSNLTLFCCSSLEFGKALSLLMDGVSVTCFNEDIYPLYLKMRQQTFILQEAGMIYKRKNGGIRVVFRVFFVYKSCQIRRKMDVCCRILRYDGYIYPLYLKMRISDVHIARSWHDLGTKKRRNTSCISSIFRS